jgi:hypothetical protein
MVYICDVEPLQFILSPDSKSSVSEWEIVPHKKSENLCRTAFSKCCLLRYGGAWVLLEQEKTKF